MRLSGLTARKLAGGALTPEELAFIASGAADGSLDDAELTEWLRAVCAEGLSYAETFALTRALAASGEQLSWEGLPAPVVDKHSTGGVGDKVSLLLAPWAAAAGLCLVKMSGRALGHTGGTADKLECIPGFRVGLNPSEMADVLRTVGCCIATQSARLAPADKRLYRLRDQSGTVMQLGLIAASVLSKKLACGAPAFVLDVKCGNGALFTDLPAAREFAALAMRLAADAGRRCACVISAMDEPLGRAVGNLLEAGEVADLLEGRAASPRLEELCETLCAVLLVLAGKAPTADAARPGLRELLERGAVRERFYAWLRAQGADLPALAALRERQQREYRHIELRAPQAGFVHSIDTAALGRFVHGLERAGGCADPLCGVLWDAPLGRACAEGQILATALASPADPRSNGEIAGGLGGCFRFSAVPIPSAALVLDLLAPASPPGLI